ncbi:MAG: ABC transporter ATP-binding protein [Candidatus Lokiarchaeota archaeon]|nr:ABC transporter ATP-binding protein [Candidatus Lokiarchaeota archaeon]
MLNDMNSLIHFQDVNFSYPNGTIALMEINLKINRGETIAIMGQNGAGKTTLIRMLNGLLRPTSGRVLIEGEDINTSSIGSLSKKIGIIFQNPMHQLFSNTVEEEIKFSLKSLDLSKEEVEQKTISILNEYRFEKYASHSPMNLSGGESKKLAIASIMCRDPDILVFDEPTLGQDANEIKFFLDMLKKESKKEKTIIMVTHNVEFAFEHVPRVVLMTNGRILADGPTDRLLTNQTLVSRSSLILPNVYKLKLGLKTIGWEVPDNIIKKADMVKFLSNYFEKEKSEVN